MGMKAGSLARAALPFVLIVALAFGYRLQVMADRAAAPNEISEWDPLPDGADQTTYLAQLHDLQTGDFPSQTFYYQPGIVYFLAAVAVLISSLELLHLRLALVALASLNCGFMTFVTWRCTGRRRAGIAAGLLLALYPVSAFYDTDFVITSQALILATLMLASTWLSYQRPRSYFFPFVSGVLLGAGAVTRFELVAPAAICILWLLANRRGAPGLLASAAGCLLLIAPVALHNRAGGADHLITPVGAAVMYHGNNRDADGRYSPSNALDTTHRSHYFHYLLHDIALEPARFIQLNLRKAAFFLSGVEGGNNLDFHKSGQGTSAVLAYNPLNFSVLLLLFIAGLAWLWRDQQRQLAALLLAAGGGFMLFVLLAMVESRIKTPVIVWMLPAAGYAIDRLLSRLRALRMRSLQPKHLLWLAAAAGLLFVIHKVSTELPRDLTVAELPADATRAGLVYDDTLELVGWKVQEQYSPRHTIEPHHPWVVSLYWRLLEPTEVDYSFSLKYYIGANALIEYDRPLGYTVYPRDRTSDWQAGVIYVEHIGLTWRKYFGPFEKTGRVTLDVYPERELHQRFAPVNERGETAEHPILAWPAILLGPGLNRIPVYGEVSFGDQLFLLGHEIQTTGEPGQQLSITTAWRAGSRQIQDEYVIGVYLFLHGEFIVNLDSSPKQGELATFSLLPDYHFDDEKNLTLPDERGAYDVYIGVYDGQSMARLAVAEGLANLHHIGTVTVR